MTRPVIHRLSCSPNELTIPVRRQALWPGRPIARAVSAMAKTEKSEMREIIRKHLDNKGYVVRLTTHREADNLIGRSHVTDASSEETVGKVGGAGKFQHLQIGFGLDA